MAILPEDKIVRGGDLTTIGSAIKTELAKKQDILVSGTNIKTINESSLLGTGDITISDGEDGKSAYEIWLDEGNIGTEEDFLASLQGNSGYTGAAGELEVVNNLTDGGATKALSAEMGRMMNSKLYGGNVQLEYTTDDTTSYLVKSGDVVEETSANRIRVVFPVKVGDIITASMELGKGLGAAIYDSVIDCMDAYTDYIQEISYSYTSAISDTSECNGFLCISLAKSDDSDFESGESDTYINALNLSVLREGEISGAIPALNDAIYGVEETEDVELDLEDADVALTYNGSEVSAITDANRIHLIFYIQSAASINLACSLNSGIAVSLYSTRANALLAGNNWLESYTSGGYATSVEATSAYAGYLNVNYKNASGGKLTQQDYDAFMAAVSVAISFTAIIHGDGIIPRLQVLESGSNNTERGNDLYIGKVCQGIRGTQTISSSPASVTMDTVAVPFAKASIKAHLPSGIVADILYSTTSQNLTNSTTIGDGDSFLFPDNITYYCINFRNQGGGSIGVADIQRYVDSGVIRFSIVNGDDTTATGRNVYNEPYALAPMRKGVLSGYGTYLSIAHASDFHSDAVRVKNFFDLCNHYNVQYAVHTGDVVGWPYNGFDHFVELSKTFSGKTINCNGNHDVFGTSQSDIFAYNIEPFTTALGISTDKCYYYYDDTTYNVRFVVLDVFENALTNGNNQADITGTQMNWLISTLASVPANYGVILCYHAPANAILSNNLGFYQGTTSYYTTLDNYGSGVKNAPIQKIVNAFIRKESISGTYTSHGTSYSYSADFTNVPESAEFICHMTGHEHSDRIGYYTGYDGNTSGQNKQLVFNITCGNALYGTGYQYLAHLSDMPRGGRGLVQDAVNIMTFFRADKKIQVTRLGGFIASDGSERLTAVFDYQ